jgi:glycosyltransferase involved in cell wall biosynthesis
MIGNTKICIITQSHLCRNPRVLKEACTLATAGYEIIIITCIYSTDLYKQDLLLTKHLNIRIRAISDLSHTSLASLIDRVLRKLGTSLIRYFNLETSLALGYGSYRYFKAANSINANLYICHQELATYVGHQLIKNSFKVAFDIEDWYSEDLLPDARKERPVNLLKKYEGFALKQGLFCLTTSNSLSKKLSQVYQSKLPYTLYNVFPTRTALLNKPQIFSEPLKLFWFSQTIGRGRGLEQFIEIIKIFKFKIELHLLGEINPHFSNQLVTLMEGNHTLCIHETVPEEKLAEKIAEFDIGLALELNTPLNRNFTITNKFFQYLQSGLPVIASETDGQNEGFDTTKPGFKLSQNPKKSEIDELARWLTDSNQLKLARHNAIKAAQVYNWEIESEKLINVVKSYLNVS